VNIGTPNSIRGPRGGRGGPSSAEKSEGGRTYRTGGADRPGPHLEILQPKTHVFNPYKEDRSAELTDRHAYDQRPPPAWHVDANIEMVAPMALGRSPVSMITPIKSLPTAGADPKD
jgi:hypothetical protein